LILALAVASGPPLVLSGCGDSSKPEMVTPSAPPTALAKDSMQFYLKQQQAKQTKGHARTR
jgi:hypothetical protein